MLLSLFQQNVLTFFFGFFFQSEAKPAIYFLVVIF